MKKIAIFQPFYLPWYCFFEILNSIDCFVFFDDVQFVKKTFINRNYINNNNNKFLLTVPIINKNKIQNIKDTKIDTSKNWQLKHYKTISTCYNRSLYSNVLQPFIEKIYLKNKWENLSELNCYIIQEIAKLLNLSHIKWFYSSNLKISGNKVGDRAIKICKELECDHLVNGPKSLEFLDLQLFKKFNVNLSIINYGEKKYPQLTSSNKFVHRLSIIDAIFNCGVKHDSYLKNNNLVKII